MRDNPQELDVADTAFVPRPWEAPQRLPLRFFAKTRIRLAFAGLAFILRQRVVFCAVLIVGFVCVGAVVKLIPKTYQAAAHVLIVANSTGRDPSVTSGDVPSLATSSVLLTRVAQKVGLPVDLVELKHHVKASVGTRSSLIEIDDKDEVAARAVTIANAIADELVSYYDSISGSGSDVTIRKLDRAIADVQQRLRKLGDASAKENTRDPFVQSDKALDEVTAKLDDLAAQKRVAAAALATDIAQRDAIAADPGMIDKTVRYEKLQNDAMYKELAGSIARDEAELAVEKTTLTDAHPEVQGLEKKLAAEHRMLDSDTSSALTSAQSFSSTEAATGLELRKANAAITGDQAKLDGIEGLIATANARLRDTLDSSTVTEGLKLQHDAAKADYLALTAARAAAVAGRAEALSLGSLVVVDRAVKADTTVVGLGPARLGIILAGLVFLAAVATAYVIDVLDSRLLRADQIERFYGVPLIALVDMDL